MSASHIRTPVATVAKVPTIEAPAKTANQKLVVFCR